MRLTLCVAIAVFTPVSWVHAQTIDVQSLQLNGVELRIGEDSATAIAALRDSSDVTYQGALKSWEVYRKVPRNTDPGAWMGSVRFANGVLSSILKTYPVGDGKDLSAAFSDALRDTQRGVNEACHMAYVRAHDGHVQQINTVCGPNKLTFALSHVEGATAGVSATNISVLVRAPAAKGR